MRLAHSITEHKRVNWRLKVSRRMKAVRRPKGNGRERQRSHQATGCLAVVRELAAGSRNNDTKTMRAEMNEPEPVAQTTFTNLMKAIQDNSYRDFIKQGDWGFKIGIPILMFWFVTAQLARRMRKGYQATYLGQLN